MRKRGRKRNLLQKGEREGEGESDKKIKRKETENQSNPEWGGGREKEVM